MQATTRRSPEFARLTKLGVRGLRMMSAKRGTHVPHLDPEVAARAHEHGWHVQFYPHGTDIIEYADKLLALQNAIVLDHFASIPAAGGVDQPAMKAVLRMLDTGRVWLKLSGPMRCTGENVPYPSVTPMARALRRARAGAHGVGHATGRTSISTAAKCPTTATCSTCCRTGCPTRRRATASWSTTPTRFTDSRVARYCGLMFASLIAWPYCVMTLAHERAEPVAARPASIEILRGELALGLRRRSAAVNHDSKLVRVSLFGVLAGATAAEPVVDLEALEAELVEGRQFRLRLDALGRAARQRAAACRL